MRKFEKSDEQSNKTNSFIRKYPEMNNNLIAMITQDQSKDRYIRDRNKFEGFHFVAIDTEMWTATAWCRNSEKAIIFSNDTSLTFEKAFLFCLVRNATLWIPKPTDFLDGSDFLARFESSG